MNAKVFTCSLSFPYVGVLVWKKEEAHYYRSSSHSIDSNPMMRCSDLETY